MTVIKRGLELPIQGAPEQRIDAAVHVSQVALLGDDYVGMKPTMLVSEGDRVKLGQPVFEDKKTPGVIFTAPAAGTVAAVNRGAKRKFESLVINVEGDDAVEFSTWSEGEISSLERAAIVTRLVESGLWTSLRTRPYGKVPAVDSEPAAIFVQAMDTNPLAGDPLLALPGRESHWVRGLEILTRLTGGTVYVCKGPGASLAGEGISGVRIETFEGPHPAGLPGTHIHYLEPVGPNKQVWYIGFQDVLALGALSETGRLDPRRLVALSGPRVANPRVLETRLGAEVLQLVDGETIGENNRVVSGSVLHGRKVEAPVHFLGRYSTQISVLEEGNHREFLGWQKPGVDKYSTTRVFASALMTSKLFPMTTSTEGSERAMVPLGTYERVMPLDILPTQLLRALIVRDTDAAQQLGALELEEEDLALCTFVCPGKYEYGSILRENLRKIEIEG